MVTLSDLQHERWQLLQTPCVPHSPILLVGKKGRTNIQVAKEQFGKKKKKNLLPECLTKRLAYLQYTQWATTDVAQFKIHDSCQKTKEIQIRERGCNLKVVVHCPTVL